MHAPTPLIVVALLLAACGPQGATLSRSAPLGPSAASSSELRLRICSQPPLRLDGPAEVPQSRGCVATFTQQVGPTPRKRRYLVYAPTNLPSRPVPLLLVFPGYGMSAESAAFYQTQTRFERLADRDGFIVVYGNGLPDLPSARERPEVPEGGFLQGCFLSHDDEGIDVSYVRRIVQDIDQEVALDRTRIYATGLSAGGGMAFQLALEAPELVAAIAPVAPLPFQPSGLWRFACHPRPGHERVSIAMLAATDDPFISYGSGSSPEYPEARYPGMERTRDVWLAALGLVGPPAVDPIPDAIRGDSYEPHTRRTTSTLERQRFGPAPDGLELWFYKATGMGHAWPNPTQLPDRLWPRFGKTNQDSDFADEAWTFFQRHARPSPE